MKAVVLHEYGSPSKLKYEDFNDPKPGEGEVLVHVTAVSVNPIDWKMRSGEVKERMPIDFPAVLGRDVAGVVRELGEGVTGVAEGDRVMALTMHTYAELCVVKAADITHVPKGLEMTTAAAIPLVAVTGDQLVRKAANVQPGQTILITGALGSVGRCAVFCAAEIGAKVIAGVRKSQLTEAKALPGVTEAVALDEEKALASLGFVDCVANTLAGDIVDALMAKVKQGGIFGSVAGTPTNAALHATITVNRIMAEPNSATVAHYAEAVRGGKLIIPIELVMPLAEAAEAQTLGEKHKVKGKIVLVP